MHFEILIYLSTYKMTHHSRSVPYSQLTSLAERFNAGVHHAIQRSGLEREKLSRMIFLWYE